MRGNPIKGRVGICARCGSDQRTIVARYLCTCCYDTERLAGRLDEWPLMGRPKRSAGPLPSHDPNSPADPSMRSCGWCSTPLTRSRTEAGEQLYELYTVNGHLMALCFEGCPSDLVEVG